jgi:hypothetical protein
MSLVTFNCPQCKCGVPVQSARLVDCHFIRCDRCFAITGLTMSIRVELLRAATSPPSPDRV